jgi:hypothetical protein
MPANAEDMWWENDCGVCQCGATLCVDIDDEVGMASLREVEEDEDGEGEE